MKITKDDRKQIEDHWFESSLSNVGRYEPLPLCQYMARTDHAFGLKKPFNSFWKSINTYDYTFSFDYFWHDSHNPCSEEILLLRAMILIEFLDSLEEK